MRSLYLVMTVLISIISLFPAGKGNCQVSDLLKDVKKMVPSSGETDGRIENGLIEAIEIGVQNAVSKVSGDDGYFKNPDIKILLPEKIKNLEGILRGAGLGSQIDAFELSMNRAAEVAAPEAKALFTDAVKQMTFDDAGKILQGPDDAATQYFQKNTGEKLFEVFKPIVQKTMADVGVTNYYQQLFVQVQKIPFADLSGLNLDNYVTESALDGLFFMVAQEEKKIRTDPQSRVTELLKDVFGKN